jgi:hypothetical protein
LFRAGPGTFKVIEESADNFPLCVRLAPAESARDNRELGDLRKRSDVLLGAVRERADDDMGAAVGTENRRHCGELSCEKQIQEKRLQDVVTMVSESDLATPELLGNAVENSASQSRA